MNEIERLAAKVDAQGLLIAHLLAATPNLPALMDGLLDGIEGLTLYQSMPETQREALIAELRMLVEQASAKSSVVLRALRQPGGA